MANERYLPPTTLQNDSGACWTCLKQKRICDLSLPRSRWQQISDKDSRRYLRAAAAALKGRFGNSSDLNSPVTLTIMLLLVSFEVFSGTPRWRGHFDAIPGWIRSRGDHSDLDPFLKTWVCLIETQCALNVGLPDMQEVESWIDLCPNISDTGPDDSIDALFGCSSKLPKLMCAASRLQKASDDAEIPFEEIYRRSETLQKAIQATKMEDNANPIISILCDDAREKFSATVGLEQEELRRRMIATAEIFRHTSHLYVYRIIHGVEEPLTSDMQESLQTALQLLTQVPDALGPGANLGWCLVVLGAELDLLDQRDYIRSRWYSMHLLGIYNTKSGEKILEAVWNYRDLVRSGLATPARWQDIMKDMGEHQILV
ncbi:C6 transcription factor [Colletotrichum asianum]|uniref:C6 transcription factor n=1 Tax=Colletotrichum asianum TaxID=702518 RepID=A0A8H3ZV90_9PEZI|nr:C6 transcription factor [Colletotrichum asianum]